MRKFQTKGSFIAALSPLVFGSIVFSCLPALVHAKPETTRHIRKQQCGTLTLKVTDRSINQPVGTCPVYSSLSQFTPYPKVEVHLPEADILDLEPVINFRAGSARFSVDGYSEGIDNVAPFRLLDALPKANITSDHAVINIEFFSADNASGRLIKRLKVYVARYPQQAKCSDLPNVNLMCLERVQSETPALLDTTAILEDKSLRVVGTERTVYERYDDYIVEGLKRASIFSYSTDATKAAIFPLRPSAEGGEPQRWMKWIRPDRGEQKPLYAIDRNGYVSEAYVRDAPSDWDPASVRLYSPIGAELVVRPVIRSSETPWDSLWPTMTFFFPGGFGVRAVSSMFEGESRFGYSGETIAEEIEYAGEVEWAETRYADAPNDGYYTQGEAGFNFCDPFSSGVFPYITRVPSDSTISVGPYKHQGEVQTYLVPHLTPLSTRLFPWDEEYRRRIPGGWLGEWGFQLACFDNSVIGIETDDASNAYVLFGLTSQALLKNDYNFPSASINQLQKISPAGEILWQTTLSGELFEQYFDVNYEFPGLIPISLNWIKDRDILIVIGKVPGAGKVNRNGQSHYLALFIDKAGNVVNAQELGYLLPAGERFAPFRSNSVTDTERNKLFFFSEKYIDITPDNEHWLTTVQAQMGSK